MIIGLVDIGKRLFIAHIHSLAQKKTYIPEFSNTRKHRIAQGASPCMTIVFAIGL